MEELRGNPEKNLPPDDSTKIFLLAVKVAMEVTACYVMGVHYRPSVLH